MDEEALRRAVWDDAGRVIVDATYSGRAHQIVARRWGLIDQCLGLPASILSASSAGAAGLSALLHADPLTTTMLAFISAALTASRSFLRSDRVAAEHGNKGDRYINLRNDAIRFQEVDFLAMPDVEVLSRRGEDLSERRNRLRGESPRVIPQWAYRQAKASIEAGESNYEDDPLWRGYRAANG